MTKVSAETEQLTAYVENLDNMVAYQSDAIVSKIIANKKTGTVTMFAFDEGQGVSEQSLPFDSVLFITDGEMEITIGDSDPKIVGSDEMVYIPASTAHIVTGSSSFKMFSIMIRS